MLKLVQKENKKKIIIIFQVIFIILLAISVKEIITWFKENKENKELTKEIGESITINQTGQISEDTSKYNVDFEKLKSKNSDTIAWLKVNGTDAEYVVVQATNNSYYLDHNFNKEYNKAGWIFADYKNRFDGTDKNIVVYGHNRKDGSMFGSLKKYIRRRLV